MKSDAKAFPSSMNLFSCAVIYTPVCRHLERTMDWH
ncbi:hypothetical protein KP509_22G077100 [Ceratopteris richardii]|nr:hypothetical protein KP509_22G077100 [Ceratopteris richardii]